MNASPLDDGFPRLILTTVADSGKRAASPPEPRTTLAALMRQEVPMFKALMTPIVLGLAVALVIRLSRPRRAY